MTNRLQSRIDAAMGRVECDLILKRVSWLDVFRCRWVEGELAIHEGVIVGLEAGLKAKRTLDLKGKSLVPGFIDAHVHVESSLMAPRYFDALALSKGTTAAICDPHEIANVAGPKGIQYFLDAAEHARMDLRVMMSSCVPATHFETNGAGEIPASELVKLGRHPKALGLAEMMNVPGVLNADPAILAKLEAFTGRPIDGHCPLVRGQALSAYAAAGISSCHESSEPAEALEKLSKGIALWIREGSVAKDLRALSPLLNIENSTSVGFCTDDRNPLDIFEEGHIDHLVRGAIRAGVPQEVAYRSASWSVARHYGLDRGFDRAGAIAPGYRADLVVLDSAVDCSIAKVLKRGSFADELLESQKFPSDQGLKNTIQASVPEVTDLVAESGSVHVIGVLPGKIITERLVMPHDAPGVAQLTVLERYGHGSKPANAYVRGFGLNFRGAIASSVGHDSHNLIVVGSNPRDMRAALAALIRSGGGFCVVQDGSIKAELALPIGGLMSTLAPLEVAQSLRALRKASQAAGCELGDPFLQLAFLSLPVIPSLKLTDRGLFDVERFEPISVRAAG